MSVTRRTSRALTGEPADSVDHADTARALTRGGIALVTNGGLTAVLGVLYWLVAARVFSPAEVGRGSALVAALWTVSGLAQLNYARALSGLVPRAGARAVRMVGRVYLRVGIASIVGGLAFAVAAPFVSHQYAYLRSTPALILVFALSVPVWSVFSLEDTLLATVRRAVVIPFENAVFGAAKLVLLLALAAAGLRTSFAIFGSWILPLIFIVVPINIYLFTRALPRAAETFRQTSAAVGSWVRYDFAGYLLWLVGTLFLPVIVLAFVGPVQTAAFYVPFTIASSIDLLSLNLGNALTAELARGKGRLEGPTLAFVRRVWLVVGLLSLGLLILAPQAMMLFGPRYRVSGTEILRIFALAMLPRSALLLSIAVARAQARGRLILLLQAVSSLGTLGIGLALIGQYGAVGVAVGLLIASCVAAALAVAATQSRWHAFAGVAS